MMDEHQSCEAIFLAHMQWMQSTMATACRRYGMVGADAEDFASWAMLRLLENDYAILRQFRGESSVKTYLVVVIAMLNREYRVRCWGRWRPSAPARRAGRDGVRLETLVHRDGYTVREAILMMRTSGETTQTERALAALFATLPLRTLGRATYVPNEFVDAPDDATAEDLVLTQEAQDERIAVATALERALLTLATEDRLVVRMRFWEEMTIADIARALDLPQKSLYRRMERSLATLRHALEVAGLSTQHVRSFLCQMAA